MLNGILDDFCQGSSKKKQEIGSSSIGKRTMFPLHDEWVIFRVNLERAYQEFVATRLERPWEGSLVTFEQSKRGKTPRSCRSPVETIQVENYLRQAFTHDTVDGRNPTVGINIKPCK